MSQKRKGVLGLQGKRDDGLELIVEVEPRTNPDTKRKKTVNGDEMIVFCSPEDLEQYENAYVGMWPKNLTSVKESKQAKKQRVIQPVKKNTQWVSSSFDSFSNPTISELLSGKSSQKSRSCKKEKSIGEGKPKLSAEGAVLWCDKYSPSSEVDLAVHKKKIAEVRDWLLAYLCVQTGSGILLLTGPPGAGKTATLRVLAKEIGVAIQEWINPLNPLLQNETVESDWRNYEDMVRPESQLKRFRDFFLRANKYPSLSLGASDVNCGKKIILIEDMPNLFYRSASQLHDVLSSYQRTSRNPVVFIVSDSNSNDTNAYRLFPKDVVQSLGISTISFNPASVTSLNKVGNKIVSAEAQKRNPAFQTPSKEVIDSVVAGSNGDIRGLINNLQFACLKGCSTTSQKQKYVKHFRSNRESKSKSGKSSSKKSSETESSSGSMIGGKDTSLFLFRVLGKILYCKRDENSATTSSLPAHLKHHERLPLLENAENVFEKSHMSGENLALYLHQNYLDFFNNIDDVSLACDYLSDSDHLTAEWMHRSTLSCYTPSLVIRGLMFCNHGRSPAQGKSGWRPLHKPQWYTVFKQRRNNGSTAMELFQDHSRNAVQLQCEIIPYLALSDVSLRFPGQITYLQTICKFSKNIRDSSSTLQEKEIDDDETEISSSQPRATLGKPVNTKDLVEVTRLEDDEIEEFEDD